jgi:hypothetical protein
MVLDREMFVLRQGSGELPRGVWREPYLSPAGEVLLAPVTSKGRLATGRPVPAAKDQVEGVASMLWDLLDMIDPQTLGAPRPGAADSAAREAAATAVAAAAIVAGPLL